MTFLTPIRFGRDFPLRLCRFFSLHRVWQQPAPAGAIVSALACWTGLLSALVLHVWAANRGLEMTDEASYLLIALDPWNTWGHGTFHGFLLRPLYLLGGSSVVGLRWIGYALLLFAAWRLAGAVRLRLGQAKLAAADLCTPALMVAAMTCYSAGMRTPCYNWMILVGAMLAWSGWLRSGFSGIAPWELGIGLTIAVLGKWGAAFVLLAMFAGVSYRLRGTSMGPNRREWMAALSALVLGSAMVARYAGAGGIRNTIQAGLLIAQTTGSHGWFILPKYGWEMVYYFYRVVRALVWLLPAILIFWWLGQRNPGKWPATKIATFLFAAGLSLAACRGWWRGGIEQFGKESVLAGGWLLGVAWTAWAVRRGSSAHERSRRGAQCAPVPEDILWALVVTPFLCGVGTNTSIADYAGQGTVFMVAAGILLLGLIRTPAAQGMALVALTGLCLIQAARVSSSLLGLYRVGSVREQAKLLSEGPEAGLLRVDSNTWSEIHSLGGILQERGFRPGTPVVGVDSLCGWVYLSGGQAPGVPWFFRDQPEYLKQVLARLSEHTLGSSWVWIRSSSQITDPARWWPRAGARFPKKVGARAKLKTDRGDEMLDLFAPCF